MSKLPKLATAIALAGALAVVAATEASAAPVNRVAGYYWVYPGYSSWGYPGYSSWGYPGYSSWGYPTYRTYSRWSPGYVYWW